MVKPLKPGGPKYLPAVLDLVAAVGPGEVRDVFVLHDDGCALLSGAGACNCSPTVTLGFGLWFRKGRRGAWELVATAPTEREAWGAIPSSGRRGGDWCVLPAERQP